MNTYNLAEELQEVILGQTIVEKRNSKVTRKNQLQFN